MSRKSLLIATFVALSPGAFASSEAAAQTASNLVCKGCVGDKDIGKNAVTKKKIKKNSVTSKHIKDGQVKPGDLAETAKPTILKSAVIRSDLIENLPENVDKVVRAATILAPGSGSLLASYNMSARSIAAGGVISCAATTDTTVDGDLFNTRFSVDANVFEPFSGMEVFQVLNPGEFTVNLVCRAGNEPGEYLHPILTVLFVPREES